MKVALIESACQGLKLTTLPQSCMHQGKIQVLQ
jgi:hypothetical protein